MPNVVQSAEPRVLSSDEVKSMSKIQDIVNRKIRHTNAHRINQARIAMGISAVEFETNTKIQTEICKRLKLDYPAKENPNMWQGMYDYDITVHGKTNPGTKIMLGNDFDTKTMKGVRLWLTKRNILTPAHIVYYGQELTFLGFIAMATRNLLPNIERGEKCTIHVEIPDWVWDNGNKDFNGGNPYRLSDASPVDIIQAMNDLTNPFVVTSYQMSSHKRWNKEIPQFQHDVDFEYVPPSKKQAGEELAEALIAENALLKEQLVKFRRHSDIGQQPKRRQNETPAPAKKIVVKTKKKPKQQPRKNIDAY